MKKKSLVVLAAAFLLVGVILDVPIGLAHPLDDSVFAPITRLRGTIKLETVAIGLTSPLKGVAAPGEPNRLYVVDQVGTLWAIDLTTGDTVVCSGLNCLSFLDVSNRLVTLGILGPDTFDERGFLGVAFHPAFAANGKLYTYTSEPVNGDADFSTMPMGTAADHQNVVAEWQAVSPGNPAMGVDLNSRRELLRVDWPQFNADGGGLAFGPDGMLYISMGDGGGADDQDGQDFVVATGSFPVVIAPMVGHGPTGNGQNPSNPLGTILRIDPLGNNSANGQYGIPADNPFVSAPGFLDEIFAFGFHNPFRFSFDTESGDLLVGDVGLNDIEEVDVVVKGGNYGWRIKEGSVCFDPNGVDSGFAFDQDPCPNEPPGLSDPIAQYDTHQEGHAVIGGFVYRGSEIQTLRGRYVFGDFSGLFKFPSGPHDYGRLFHIRADEANDAQQNGELLRISEFRIVPGNRLHLALLGFGQDANGELYALGNVSGLPFGDEGVVVKIEDGDDDDGDDDGDEDDD